MKNKQQKKTLCLKHSDWVPVKLYCDIFSLTKFLVVMVSQRFLYFLAVMVSSVKVTVASLILFHFVLFPSFLDVINKVQIWSLSEGNKLSFIEEIKSRAD